jgi:hypothetical protein
MGVALPQLKDESSLPVVIVSTLVRILPMFTVSLTGLQVKLPSHGILRQGSPVRTGISSEIKRLRWLARGSIGGFLAIVCKSEHFS